MAYYSKCGDEAALDWEQLVSDLERQRRFMNSVEKQETEMDGAERRSASRAWTKAEANATEPPPGSAAGAGQAVSSSAGAVNGAAHESEPQLPGRVPSGAWLDDG